MANTLNLGSGNWGAKDSLLLGYYEDGGKFFPETFDVTRATGGTRVNKNGLIETPTEIGSELITNGDFATDSNWSKGTGWSISDGKAIATNVPNLQRLQNNLGVSVIGNTYKYSINISNVSGFYSVYIFGTYVVATSNIEGIIEGEFTASSANGAFWIAGASAGGLVSATIDNVSVKEYNDKNLARIDYLDDAKGVLLTEPQSTNLVTYSEDFSNSSWTKTNSSITSNSVISPDGTLNADKLVENTTIGEKFTQKIISVSNTTIYTSTVFVKFAGREWIRFTDAQSSNRIHFNTKTGVFGVISGTVIDYNSIALSNGWYKLSLTTTSVATAYAIRIVLAENDNDVSYTGNGTDGVYIWGAQLEQLSHSTSYIKTEGSTVTRNKDEVTNGGDVNSFNSKEGVLYAEVATLYQDGQNATSGRITLSSGGTSNRILIYFGASQVKFYYLVAGNPSLTYSANADSTDFNKIAISYKENELKFWLNGVLVDAKTSNVVFPTDTLNVLNLSAANGILNFFGKTKNIQVFNEALSDSDLLSLTTTGSVPYWTQYSAMATTLNYTNK